VAHDYKDLLVWQKAMQLVREMYRATATFPNSEKFGLTSQMQRASVSIVSNIAEGQGRLTPGEFKQFLGNARGSLFELETQVLLAEQLNLLAPELSSKLQSQIQEVARLLNGLLRSLDRRKAPTR
jgi:four helix bundle protein